MKNGRYRLRNLCFVEIKDNGQVVWQNLCPGDITLRLEKGTWGLKQKSCLVGCQSKGKPLPTQFFKIGARLRRFCRYRPGTIAVLDATDEWQVAMLQKVISRLIRWGILVQPEGVKWPKIAQKSTLESEVLGGTLDTGFSSV